jgi:hypothetical protein
MSKLEDEFDIQLKATGLDKPYDYKREYMFAKPRRYRFDFAFPALNVAIEIEGGSWSGGRHVRGSGFQKDCEKYNLAAVNGWIVVRGDSAMVKDGRLLEWTEKAVKAAEKRIPF